MKYFFIEEEYFEFEQEEIGDSLLEGNDNGNTILDLTKKQVNRIEVTRRFGGYWSGVSGCNDRTRIQGIFNANYIASLKNVIQEYSHSTYIDSSATGGWATRSVRGTISRALWCRGNLVNAKLVAIFEDRNS